MKRITGLFAVVVLFGCQEKHYGSFTISGRITNAPSNKILLQELPYGGEAAVVLDSASLQKNGTFTLRGIGKEENLYRLLVENGPDVLFVNDGNDIKLDLDVNNYRQYKITGSPASESLHTLLEDYRNKDSVLYTTFVELDSLQKQNASDSVLTLLGARRDQQVLVINKTITDFIEKSPSPAARYYALGMGARTLSETEIKKLANASADKFKEHTGLAKIKSLLNAQKAPDAAPTQGLLNKQAPEINSTDTEGNAFALSSLKGKYVLVDFWASWCGPCRQENPNVVAAYNQFRNKNFTILGVSLDSDKSKWLQAIKDDKLTWKHVSDLKEWESSVVGSYQIEGIPFNVLLDPQGKVIAQSLRGEDLINELNKVLK